MTIDGVSAAAKYRERSMGCNKGKVVCTSGGVVRAVEDEVEREGVCPCPCG